MSEPTTQDQLGQLASYLVGVFSNQQQAIAEPAWYVHLRLWQVPIPDGILDGYALFAEQANVLDLSKPYRQRILQLYRQGTELMVQYYALINPSLWRGAGADPRRLHNLTIADLKFLENCRLDCRLVVSQADSYYLAHLQAGCQCFFDYNGARRQVSLGFKVNPTELISYDKGIDPETGAAIWGAIAGGYHFMKIT